LIIEDACPDFGCYGNRDVRTPNVDALARESRLYQNAFATAAICSASRSAFMTGRYQTSFGAHNHRSHRDDGFRRPAGVRLITERLREAGYFTANIRALSPALGFAGTGKTDWNFQDDGKAFDGEKWSELKLRQPFYAQVNLAQTHRPYRTATVNPTDPANVTLPPYLANDPTIRADWAAYLDELSSVDEKIGAVLKLLDREGLRENTVVFFFADHGREDFRGKYYGYEQGVHVPLLVRWPALLPPGSTSDELVSLLDVHAMSLSLAGVKADGLDGTPFFGPEARRRESLFGARDRIDESHDRIRSIRDARYKFYRNFEPGRPYLQPMAYAEVTNPTYNRMRQLFADGKLDAAQAKFMAERRPVEELYDLSVDPFELHNLAVEPHAAATVARLRTKLDTWIRESGDQGGALEDPKAVEKEMEKLDNSVRRMRKVLKLENTPAVDGPVNQLATGATR
jgi:arylsulfatase A-like enzyme